MSEQGQTPDLEAVKSALRLRLAQRGKHLAGDSLGSGRALYVMGPNDLAAAVFEFKASAEDAIYDLMYQGTWAQGMPPRFAVIPTASADADSLETLEHMKAYPLLFDTEDGEVRFRDLDAVLDEHLGV